ncbi:condensin-2 complex subunit G2 [Trichonephila clavipes]|nr:condensin-2 complex subunit G2 [Trichonephila clavipes]
MKITPLKVLRIDADKTLRLSVAFQFSECPGTGFQKVSVAVGRRNLNGQKGFLGSFPTFWYLWHVSAFSCLSGVQIPGWARSTRPFIPSDTKEIQSLLAGSLLLMRSHAMLKELVSSITFTVTKNILNSILNSIDNWDDIERKCNPFESIPILKSGAFLLTMMCMKPKIIVYFLQQLKNYLINSAKDIKTWVACYVIVGSMLIKSVQPQCPPIGVVVRRGEVPGQVSSSLDQGSAL